MTNLAARLFGHAVRNGKVEIDTTAAESHFFGALVLKSSGYTPQMVTQWKVIDGQQRLTTMQLMMAAVAEELDLNGHGSVVTPLRNLISNYPHEKPFAKRHLKIVHSSDHYAGFFEAMDPDSDKSGITGPMGECFRYFRAAVSDWLRIRGTDTQSSQLAATALTTVIMVKLDIVGIYLDSQEQEHKIFESLNARGEPLTEWDKTKNFMLYKADETSSVNQDDFFEKYLDRFDDQWWRENVGRGAGIRPRSDVFADYWLESKTAKEVGARRVFREFETFVNNESDCLEGVGEELISDAAYFKKYEQNQSAAGSVERDFHNRRLSIGVGAWWPMLMRLNRVLNEMGGDEQLRSQCFKYLESFLIRRIIVGHQARSYNQIGFEFMGAIEKSSADPTTLLGSIRELLLGYTHTRNKWPEDVDVKWAVLNRKLPLYAQKLILEAVENALIPRGASYQQVPTNLEVEHLMPQRWHENDWPMQSDDVIDDPMGFRDDLIQKLGNLTLITGGLNKSLSNRSWKHKRELIKKSDNLFMNKRLLDDASGTWDERKIVSRGTWMAGKVCEIWTRPDDVANN